MVVKKAGLEYNNMRNITHVADALFFEVSLYNLMKTTCWLVKTIIKLLIEPIGEGIRNSSAVKVWDVKFSELYYNLLYNYKWLFHHNIYKPIKTIVVLRGLSWISCHTLLCNFEEKSISSLVDFLNGCTRFYHLISSVPSHTILCEIFDIFEKIGM